MTLKEKLSVSVRNRMIFGIVDNNSSILGMEDYNGPFPLPLKLEPGQKNISRVVEIVADNETEIHHEKFTLDLATQQLRVDIPPAFKLLTATIVDDDGMQL